MYNSNLITISMKIIINYKKIKILEILIKFMKIKELFSLKIYLYNFLIKIKMIFKIKIIRRNFT